MLVYQAEKQEFLHDAFGKSIGKLIEQRYLAATGHHVGHAELQSWEASLTQMAKVLWDDGIPADIGVAVEFHIPQSSKRIDVTLTGYGEDGRKTAVIVELKQWSKVQATPKDAIVRTFVGQGQREMIHPSYQAWSYAALLEGFNEAVYEGDITLRPCAYLHNYEPRDGVIDAPHYAEHIARAPLFLGGDNERDQLRAFIKQHMRRGDGKTVLYELENGRIRPSKALADSLSKLIQGQPEFVLIDDQKGVHEACKAAALSATAAQPRVVIVQGGPGTGKTVVAVNLLVALTGQPHRLVGQYVSKNAAPRKVYEAKLAGTMKRSRFGSLFTGSGAFVNTDRDTYDFLVVDEAHRLNEKSGLYGNLGENQVKEAINAAKCTIFFIDEDQRVTLADIGTREVIRAYAKEKGALVEEYELASQFRCSGSDGYLAWLDNTLAIRPTANAVLDTTTYDFRVFDDPAEMHAAIEARNQDNKARVVAGYCWPWNSKKSPAAFDIEIAPGYRRRWNLDTDGSLWIITPSSINEVGCIHTCQGLEVDYVGVIVGPDLVVRSGQVVTVPEARARQDQTIKGYRTKCKADPAGAKAAVDLIIKNTYRTLMTRGMKGCYVYCTDAETREYLRQALTCPLQPALALA